MISWATVCLVFLIYFGYKGIRFALRNRELPEPAEGDYEIKVVGRAGNGRLIAVMTPHKVVDEKKTT